MNYFKEFKTREDFQQWIKKNCMSAAQQKRKQEHEKKVIEAFKEISRINKFSRD